MLIIMAAETQILLLGNSQSQSTVSNLIINVDETRDVLSVLSNLPSALCSVL